MSYVRVIPRDLFNEADLLKCYGKLALWVLDKSRARRAQFSNDQVAAFAVIQRPSDGALFLANLWLIVGSKSYRLIRPLNARGLWPLYAEDIADDDAEAVQVFTPEGNPTREMLQLMGEPANG